MSLPVPAPWPGSQPNRSAPQGEWSPLTSAGPCYAVARKLPVARSQAPIDWVEAPATALPAENGTFDVVLCQHGLQFFPDRLAAVTEMHRVTRPGGTLVLSTWAAERPLGLFGPMIEAMVAAGMPEPFPGAYDPSSYSLDDTGLRSLSDEAGMTAVEIELLELDAVWPDMATATATVFGTPYGSSVQSLDPIAMAALLEDFARRLDAADDGRVIVSTAAHLVTATV